MRGRGAESTSNSAATTCGSPANSGVTPTEVAARPVLGGTRPATLRLWPTSAVTSDQEFMAVPGSIAADNAARERKERPLRSAAPRAAEATRAGAGGQHRVWLCGLAQSKLAERRTLHIANAASGLLGRTARISPVLVQWVRKSVEIECSDRTSLPHPRYSSEPNCSNLRFGPMKRLRCRI